MQSLSVVIICKNEAADISKTLQSLEGLTNDVVVYDNGSTDGSIEIIRKFNVHLHQGSWEGFGKTKNKAIDLAQYDWVLSLDADEAIDAELKQALLDLQLDDKNVVYQLKFKNFLGNQYLRYGEWGNDKHIRLFNRTQAKWDAEPVHEHLLMQKEVKIVTLKGFILHQTMKDMQDYASKMAGYAMLNAQKYFQQGKKSSWYKTYLSPGFSFIQNYFFKGGFLDGYAGYVCARMTANYTFLKYTRLKELNRKSKKGNKQETP